MPREIVTTKSSGGGGFTFADRAAAGLLLQMLRQSYPFEREIGPIVEFHFETRESGHVLDDFLVVTERGGIQTRCSVSVKSNRQLSKEGFNREFVTDAWEQWRGAAGFAFNQSTDLLCLIVGAVDDAVLQEWLDLRGETASTTPERLLLRLGPDGPLSQTKRKMFESLEDTSTQSRDPLETARLLSRLRLFYLSDYRESEFLHACSEAVPSGTAEDGAQLWSRLLELSAKNRGTGGTFDLAKLIRFLRPEVELKDFPDYEADWNRLASVCDQNVKSVRTVIGDGLRLTRIQEKADIESRIKTHNTTVVLGESASGKSALLAQIAANGGYKRTIWLTAGQLSKASQVELSQSFGLRHPITDLIVKSTTRSCVLIFDGYEKLEGHSRQRALEVVAAIKQEGFVNWKIVVTCQLRWRESLRDSLIQLGITDGHEVELDKPTLFDVVEAVKHLPELHSLLFKAELEPILTNLVMLDWIVRAKVAGILSASQQSVRETAVIGLIWQRWIGEGPERYSRESLLRTLGEQEGQRLSGAVHIDNVPHDQLGLLGTLENEGLIRVSSPSIQFQHDLMGDWARHQVLLFAEKHVAQEIKKLSGVPRWEKAIRLYAQGVAEKDDGLHAWKALVAELSGDDAESKVASDLCLDGLLFAANSELLLEQLWPDLVAEKAVLLHRVLKRLLNVASFPDWRFQSVPGVKDREQLAVWFRIPYPLQWYPVLRVLRRHASEVTKGALLASAEVCTLYLRTMPAAMAGRAEAAQLIAELAKEVQDLIAEGALFGDSDKIVYEGLLCAGRDIPDEVEPIALELCARRPEPEHAVLRREEARKREEALEDEWRKKNPNPEPRPTPPADIFSFRDRTLRPPDPDGPASRVPEGFRNAVLDTHGLSGLMATRPTIAKEVALAVCIEEPQPIEDYMDRSFLHGLGLTDWTHGYPTLYWKGPFLTFLQLAPEEGLDLVIRLTNYATVRWLERAAGPAATPEERAKYALKFDFGNGQVLWYGDPRVYGWHRTSSLDGAPVEAALIALEKWFYDELSERRSVDQWIDRIYSHGHSLAFAGVLISLGLKHPALFTRKLQLMLGQFRIYQCQLESAVSEQSELWVIALSGQGQEVIRRAVEWHRMPHRRVALQNLVYNLLQDQSTREFLAKRRVAWTEQFAHITKDRHELDMFLARFELENYRETTEAEGTFVELQLQPEVEEQLRIARQESELKSLSVELSVRARQYLDQPGPLATDGVVQLVEDLRRLERWRVPKEELEKERFRINAIAGGLAMLVVHHQGWLSENSEVETWCFELLQRVQPPQESELFSPGSVNNHGAEGYLGEAGIALLCRRREDWVMKCALEGLTGAYYSSTMHSMWRAYLLRDELGPIFSELVNIVVLWSALRRGASAEFRYHAVGDQLGKYRAPLLRRFRAGNLNGALIPLKRAELLGRRLSERIARRRMSDADKRVEVARREYNRLRERDRKLDRERAEVDCEVLQSGFGFLWDMVRHPRQGDTPGLQEYITELFELEMRTLPRPADSESHSEINGTPHQFDQWVLPRVAEFVAQSNSVELARRFYRPIVELGPAGRYWVEDFLQAWCSSALALSADLLGFAAMWQDLANYALSMPSWQPRHPWSRAESIVVDVLGLRGPSVLAQAKYTVVVHAMAPVFEQWARLWLRHGFAASQYAQFLVTESGRELLARGTKELAQVVDSFGKDDWHRQALGVVFTGVLDLCWSQLRDDAEEQAELRSAFMKILAALSARQVPEALHLRSKLSSRVLNP